MLTLIALFFAGALWDALITVDLTMTVEGRTGIAFCTTFILTVLSCTLYNEVIVVEGWQSARVLALAFGSGFGAAGIIAINNWRKRGTT